MVLYFLAHEVLPSMFVLYTSHRYAWDERAVGLLLVASLAVAFRVTRAPANG